jgi:hypothetical protein
LLGLLKRVALGAKGGVAQSRTAGFKPFSAITPLTAIKATGAVARPAGITSISTAGSTRATGATSVSRAGASPVTSSGRLGALLARAVIASHGDDGFLGHSGHRCGGWGLSGGCFSGVCLSRCGGLT